MGWRSGSLMSLWLLAAQLLAEPLPAGQERRWFHHYQQAMEQQDGAALAALIAPQTKVVVTLVLDQQQHMVVTLSRDEYLQQQRALWRFAATHRVRFSEVEQRKQGAQQTVTFRQHESYQLFGESLQQESLIVLTLSDRARTAPVIGVTARTLQR